MRVCTKCGTEKPLDEFHRDVSARQGHSLRCKECARDHVRKWNAENKERKAATKRAYYSVAANREKKRQSERASRIANLDARRAADREYAARNSGRAVERVNAWRKKNADVVPLRRRTEAARRRAMIRRACPAWADHKKIFEVYTLADRLSRETGVPHEVDHILPLAGRTMCGLHVHTNLRAIPASENRKKSSKELSELIQSISRGNENGRLSQ